MPVDHQGTRRHWYLPLFGGAEMNRIKRPPPPPEKVYLTLVSHLYPVQFMDSVQSTPPVFAKKEPAWSWDQVTSTPPTFIAGTLKAPLQLYEAPPDMVTSTPPVYLEGTLRNMVTSLNAGYDSVTSTPVVYQDGTLKNILLTYLNWPTLIAEESVKGDPVVFMNGTLT